MVDLPVRQWVLSLPPPLRFILAYDAQLCSRVLSLFLGEVFRWLRWTAKRELGLASVSRARCGAFTAIHRAGSSLNLNLHFHSGVLDGIYLASTGPADQDRPEFRALPPPKRDDLVEISRRVYQRTRELFISLGRDWEQPEQMDEVELVSEQEWLLVDCAQASLRGVGLLGPEAGQRILPLTGLDALQVPADLQHLEQRRLTGGFDLQANRRVRGDDRSALERLCRYILHPSFAHDRLQLTSDGRVRVQFTRPWRNGVDSITLDPLNFIARLVPLVPRPGSHQLRYHGILARRAEHRSSIIPPRPADGAQLPLFERGGKATKLAQCDSHAAPPAAKIQRVTWARLLKRMAGYEMEVCPECGAALAIVEVVLVAHEVQRKLEARGLLDPIPPLGQSPSRGPPPPQLAFDFSTAD